MTLRQKMALTIIGMTMLPPFSGIVGEALFDAGEIVGLLGVLLPLGIIWALFHFRNQTRRLVQE